MHNEPQPISVAIVQRGEQYLLLRRAPYLRYYGGFWVPPAGTLFNNETVAECAVRETFEETQLRVTPIRAGKPFISSQGERILRVNPVLCELVSGSVKLNSESSAHAWASLKELWNFKLVPSVPEGFESVGLNVPSKAKQESLF